MKPCSLSELGTNYQRSLPIAAHAPIPCCGMPRLRLLVSSLRSNIDSHIFFCDNLLRARTVYSWAWSACLIHECSRIYGTVPVWFSEFVAPNPVAVRAEPATGHCLSRGLAEVRARRPEEVVDLFRCAILYPRENPG